ncbi:RNA polymerase sigma factor [Clostridium mediterraneense]|uniref:RNA polymerase sigma factor n=1 Tax=Clostridium mediterraneense TaxID=1805472 RepID=UPI00082FA9FD|nr:sigma-70 family RNA polymerase sigma factor [Clostridium mediterraneense]
MTCNYFLAIEDIQKTKDKKRIEEMVNEFTEIINNISSNNIYEGLRSELTIFFIELIYKINLDKFSNDNHIKGFIIKSLVNKRTDIFRKYLKIKDREVSIENLTNNFLSFDSYDLSNEFYTLIENLSEKQRYVISLEFIEGFTDSEVAKIMNISRQAVNSMKNRAIASLRKAITQNKLVLCEY